MTSEPRNAAEKTTLTSEHQQLRSCYDLRFFRCFSSNAIREGSRKAWNSSYIFSKSGHSLEQKQIYATGFYRCFSFQISTLPRILWRFLLKKPWFLDHLETQNYSSKQLQSLSNFSPETFTDLTTDPILYNSFHFYFIFVLPRATRKRLAEMATICFTPQPQVIFATRGVTHREDINPDFVLQNRTIHDV